MSSQEVADEWLEETKDMTGVQLDITVSSQMSTMMLTSSGGSVTLASTNLDDLKEAVSALQEKAWNIPGVLNVSSDAGEGATQIRVVIDPLDAMAHGMTPMYRMRKHWRNNGHISLPMHPRSVWQFLLIRPLQSF